MPIFTTEAPDRLWSQLAELSKAQLIQVAESRNIRVSKNDRASSLRAQLFASMRAKHVWDGIVGKTPADGLPVDHIA